MHSRLRAGVREPGSAASSRSEARWQSDTERAHAARNLPTRRRIQWNAFALQPGPGSALDFAGQQDVTARYRGW